MPESQTKEPLQFKGTLKNGAAYTVDVRIHCINLTHEMGKGREISLQRPGFSFQLTLDNPDVNHSGTAAQIAAISTGLTEALEKIGYSNNISNNIASSTGLNAEIYRAGNNATGTGFAVLSPVDAKELKKVFVELGMTPAAPENKLDPKTFLEALRLPRDKSVEGGHGRN